MHPQNKFTELPTLRSLLTFPFSGLAAKNRLLKASLTERMASWSLDNVEGRGVPSEELVRLYETWAEWGYGIVLTGNIMVDNVNLENMGNMTVPPHAEIGDERFKAYERISKAVRKHGSLLIAQISHAGRQVRNTIQPDPVSASAIQLEENEVNLTANTPHAATLPEIRAIITNFVHAATYLSAASFHGIQLHAAHGYLLSQFLSLTTNHRTDHYGPQSISTRALLLLEIGRAIRAAVPRSFILGVKINSIEFDSGITPAEAGELCRALEGAGFDFIELSGGTYKELGFKFRRESTRKREAFFLEFAERILEGWEKRRTRVYVTGGFRSVGAMREALVSVDGVGLGRPSTQVEGLAREIIGGGIERVPVQVAAQDDFMLTAMICGAQMRQIGEGREVLDGSKEEVIEEFTKKLQEYISEILVDERLEKYLPLKF